MREDRRRPASTVGRFASSAATTARLMAGGRLAQPSTYLACQLSFADGSTSFVFRETAVRGLPTSDPAVLVVRFRLAMSPGVACSVPAGVCAAHTIVRWLSRVLSKLWLADLQTGVYRRLYEWEGAELAVDYAETLARLLRIFSVPGSVGHHVVPAVRRDGLLRDPTLAVDGPAWSRLSGSIEPVTPRVA